MTSKVCRTCHVLKHLDEFHKQKTCKDGRESQCKTCRNAQCAATKKRRYNESASVRRSSRNATLKQLYGITVDEYEEMLKQQRGVCAICSQIDGSGRRLAVDHCHTTGKIRGLLCTACNIALGKLKDSPELLANAIKYLQENQ